MQTGARLRPRPGVVAAGVTVAVLAFGRVQNGGHLTGGDISPAKVLWLNITLICFAVLPFMWWRWASIDHHRRRVFGLLFGAFAVRAAVELPMLYLTDLWRCSYGIAHDLTVAGLIGWGLVKAEPGDGPARRADLLAGTILALLLAEALFAWMFCGVADPATGTYFAGSDAIFARVNRITWWVVVPAYLVLGGQLWATRRDLRAGGRRSPGNPSQE